jgi:hypothetical protein
MQKQQILFRRNPRRARRAFAESREAGQLKAKIGEGGVFLLRQHLMGSGSAAFNISQYDIYWRIHIDGGTEVKQ